MFLQEKGHYLGTEAMTEGKRLLDANLTAVDAYMDRAGPGPSNEDPRFAWERTASHPWNRAVVRILASNFKTYASTAGIAHLAKLLRAGMEGGKAEDYGAALDKIADIVADKFANQQRRYRTLMRKMTSLNGLSALEVKETLKGKLRASQTASRRNERKRNVGYFSKFVMFQVNISLFQRYLRRATVISEQLVQATSSPVNSRIWQDLE